MHSGQLRPGRSRRARVEPGRRGYLLFLDGDPRPGAPSGPPPTDSPSPTGRTRLQPRAHLLVGRRSPTQPLRELQPRQAISSRVDAGDSAAFACNQSSVTGFLYPARLRVQRASRGRPILCRRYAAPNSRNRSEWAWNAAAAGREPVPSPGEAPSSFGNCAR